VGRPARQTSLSGQVYHGHGVRRCMTIISRAVSILISSAVSLCVEFVLSVVDIASYNGNVILGISQWREQ